MSSPETIVLTEFDHTRLTLLLARLRREQSLSFDAADALEEELERATIVPPQEVPADVVTMNSEALVVDLETEQTMRVRVVFPAAAAPGAGKVSVLAPLGLALLGGRVGEEITWQMPGGPRRLQIRKVVFQPEAAGRFDL